MTHTPAQRGNLTIGENGTEYSLAVTTELKLDVGDFTVIAHAWWFDEAGLRHDAARSR